MENQKENSLGIDKDYKLKRKKSKGSSGFPNAKPDTSWIHESMEDIYINKRYILSEERISEMWMIKTDEYFESNKHRSGGRRDTVLYWSLNSPRTSLASKRIVYHRYNFHDLYDLLFQSNKKIIQTFSEDIKQSIIRFNLQVEKNFQEYEEGAEPDQLRPEGLYKLDKATIVILTHSNLVFTVNSLYQYRGSASAILNKKNEENPDKSYRPILLDKIEKNRILNGRHDRMISLGTLRIGGPSDSKEVIILCPLYVLGKSLTDP